MPSNTSTRRTAPIALILMGLLVAIFAVLPAGGARAATCTASPVTDPMSVTVDPATQIHAWDNITVTFGGEIADGHCAGDAFSFDLPPEFSAPDGSSWPLLAPDGSVVANMVVNDGTVTVTLTEFVENHTDVQVEGWLTVQVDATHEPGEEWTATWDINGEVTTDLTMEECPDCGEPSTNPAKWGVISGEQVITTLQLPVSVEAGQTYEWTDTVGAGQAIICPTGDPASVPGIVYGDVTVWGDPVGATAAEFPVTDCSATTISGTWTAPAAGVAARLEITATITEELESYTDEALVTTLGETDPVEAEVRRFDGGGSGSGVRMVTTTTTTTTTSTTTSPTTTAPPTTTTSTTTTVPPTTTSTTSTTTTVPPTTTTSTTPPVLAYTGSGSTGQVLSVAAGLIGVGVLLLIVTRVRPVRQRH